MWQYHPYEVLDFLSAVPGVVQNESDKKLLDKIKEIVEKNIENPDFNIDFHFEPLLEHL